MLAAVITSFAVVRRWHLSSVKHSAVAEQLIRGWPLQGTVGLSELRESVKAAIEDQEPSPVVRRLRAQPKPAACAPLTATLFRCFLYSRLCKRLRSNLYRKHELLGLPTFELVSPS